MALGAHRVENTLRGPTDPEPASPLPRALLLRCLDGLRHGLLILDEAGRVALCTEPARALLAALAPDLTEPLSPRRLIAALRGAGALARADILRAARRLREEGAVSLDLCHRDRTVQVSLSRVPGTGMVATLEDISARRAAEASAAETARLDPLTRLPNRLLLRERLGAALDRLARRGEGCALLLVDLDRFKPVNDTLGHPVGDALLEKVADRLRATVRAEDTVARIGGDEFVVLQSAVRDAADTTALAQRLVDLIGRAYMIEGHLVSIGASLGIALAPQDGTDPDRLLKSADLALYRAKRDGRATFRFFEPTMDAQMQARRQLELDMRQALARREFEIHYQPQLNLLEERLTGCEALLRWRHPVRGMVSPAEFIPLAEEIGLIVPIGDWVIRQACHDAVRWPRPITVAVNVSPAQFKGDRLVDTVVSALARSGLPAPRLEIEITEGLLLQDDAQTLRTLHRLRDLGVRVSMDDFGTGYSSLSYLRAFPFDKIKIDRSFVRDMAQKPDGDAIIRAIAGLGRSLGMTTVAEGVETPEQMRRIRAEGCTDVQGYLVSRPIPADDLLALLARS
ncbi:diguanylate cyclase/phosphodiesterase [Methylobacterium sp. 4-46]|uniref:putative bifunctional diguanylate cyclase/phosphodiesterase n=1 Tax=unclassified Methylobacterium TaxID=2615210 RepID=UPI000152D19D|nr:MULTISPECIES: EAL domain-containing protein [Methylobacterium]ACA16311.1 diguanylate cyclase/phosphodiesterase [Methylobacterium sp. 4-46]WFT82019.1 EAL domain-containing protein [Methylobacterium nodulans]